MDAIDVIRWSEFAEKGGIGKCVAISNSCHTTDRDLIFSPGEEIVVLRPLDPETGLFLGSCGGILGEFSKGQVEFLTKLSTPVMVKRSSLRAPGTARNDGLLKSPPNPYRTRGSTTSYSVTTTSHSTAVSAAASSSGRDRAPVTDYRVAPSIPIRGRQWTRATHNSVEEDRTLVIDYPDATDPPTRGRQMTRTRRV